MNSFDIISTLEGMKWKEWSSKNLLKQWYEWKKLILHEKMWLKKWSTFLIPIVGHVFNIQRKQMGGLSFEIIWLIQMWNWFKTYIFHWGIIESQSCKLYRWFWIYKRKETSKFINIKSICLLKGWWKQITGIILLHYDRTWTKFTRKHQITQMWTH
jgi:hypothetical protein